ncbi:MAG: MBOAT family protein [Clostridia bacterium]|nr:MBOAT family protein [Clostridia bacterium]
MLFNSYVFVLFFFPIVLIGYFGLNHFGRFTAAKVFLILASLFFYGYFNWRYLPIIVLSVALNYTFSRIMLNERTGGGARKLIFAASLALNIGSLFFFKYYDFFVENVNAVFKTDWPLLHILLPLGISFFTFQQLSYVIDSYRRNEKIVAYRFFDYALFVTYFPQLIAGPIVTHDEMVPQFADVGKKKFNPESFSAGLYAFALGMGKKVIVADTFGLLVNTGFGKISVLGPINAFMVMLAYTFQIYFDFSGYCDMATGIGKMMNIDITMNFNSPYKAVNISDFWKRWHITLTRFFTKYIYIPLGGNRRGAARTYVNIMIVFLVSGIWHGANWTFIVWGLLHGIAQVLTRVLDRATGIYSKRKSKIVSAVSWLFTFAFVNLAWVIFRADSLTQAWQFYRQFFDFSNHMSGARLLQPMITGGWEFVGKIIPASDIVLPAALFVFAFTAGVFMKNTNERIAVFKPDVKKSVFTAATLFWCIMSLTGVATFLYWNF